MKYLKTIGEIALFRAKPHDVDYNILYLIAAFGLVLFIGISTAIEAEQFNNPGGIVLVKHTLLGALFYLVLLAHKKPSRFVQSASALFGIIALCQIFALFFSFLLKSHGSIVIFQIWVTVLQVYIIRETLECKTPKAIGLFIGIELCITMIILSAFPEVREVMQAMMDEAAKLKTN